MSVFSRLHARCGSHHHALEDAVDRALAATEAGAALGRPFALASSQRHFERDRPFVVTHLSADLTLDFDARRVKGEVTLTLRRVDPFATEITLDAVGFEDAKVTVGGVASTFANDGKTLRVPLPLAFAEGRLAVTYSVVPRRGLYFLAPDEHVLDRPRQVWTQCQDEDARHFLPCHDSPHVKMTTEMRVTAPNGYSVLSNGALVSKDTPAAGAWTFHYRMDKPHPSYLLTVVAGEFAEVHEEEGGVPLSYLVPKNRAGDVERTFGRTAEMMRHFGALLGVPYPWNKYAQVVVSDFIFGGMENTTATTLYEHTLLDERAALDITSDDLIAHELAHQWFGDYVTCRDWSEGWLNEGFATFMEHVFREHRLGRDEYELGLRFDLEAYLGEAHGRYRRPVVSQVYDAPADLFDRHLYEKGGLVLHLLRTTLGDTLFWQGVGNYLRRHAHGIVETRDLMRALEEVSGKSLGRLFDQWIYRPGHPELEVEVGWNKGVLSFAVKQTHSHADDVPQTFDLELFVDVADAAGGVRREALHVKARSETFFVAAAERPAFVVVDPEARLIGELSLKAPDDMLHAALAGAKSARGRWLAAQALAKSDTSQTVAKLAARLVDEGEFWGVRTTCAESLGKIRGKESEAALRTALAAKHPKVRRAVCSALGAFRTASAAEALKPKALGDASYLVEAEAARALGRTKQSAQLETLVDLLDRPSWADVIRVGAVDGLAALRDDRATPHLVARTRYGHTTRTRRAAIGALPKLLSDRRGRETLEELLDDADPHLRLDVVRALVEMGDAKARGALRARLDVELDGRVRRRLREALRDLGGEGKRAVEAVREELEKVQNEHAELKTRLAALEARVGGGPAKGDGKGDGKVAASAKKSDKGDPKGGGAKRAASGKRDKARKETKRR